MRLRKKNCLTLPIRISVMGESKTTIVSIISDNTLDSASKRSRRSKMAPRVDVVSLKKDIFGFVSGQTYFVPDEDPATDDVVDATEAFRRRQKGH